MKAILASTLLMVALQSVPGAAIAATEDTESLTTADLLAQAQDPAVAGPTADPAAAPAAAPETAAGFPPDQLEQLVAPIALYPDALLMQILMASTYPLEVVEADRWISGQPDLKGEALDKALLEKDWDPSVESLTTLPDVLKRMSENLDWTQDLGDAFLEQEDQLLDTVQVMRGKAYEAGNLQTSEQQVVTQQPDKIIVIQSAQPEVVYVPTYSPTVVYGVGWGYPSYYYPPMYPYYPPGYGLVSFGVGMAVGAAIWGDCHWGWGGSDVDIDINRYNEFNRNTNINADRTNINRGEGGGRGRDKAAWNHDSSHRKGVNYKNPQTAQKFGAGAGSNRVTKDQARGRTSTGAAGGRQTTGTAQARDRSGASSNARTPQSSSVGASRSDRASTSQANRTASQANRAGTSQANRGASQANRSGASQLSRGNSAYSGSRSPSADRMSSSRGASSRGAASYGGSRGGGARAGGGRRR